MKPTDKKFLTRPEAAAYLGVSKQWMATNAKKGRGPKFKIVGRRAMYALADLDEYWKSLDYKYRTDGVKDPTPAPTPTVKKKTLPATLPTPPPAPEPPKDGVPGVLTEDQDQVVILKIIKGKLKL